MSPAIIWTLVFVAGALALFFVWYLVTSILRESPGNAKMKEVSAAIRAGAMAFLRREFITLAVFTVVVFIVLAIFIDPKPFVAVAYLAGTLTSALAGWLGMNIATSANAPEVPRPETQPAQTIPTSEELNRMVRDLPRASVEAFSRAVQPVLLNRCTTSGCHGPHCTSRFRLLRTRPGSHPRRLVTQRNLHATLQWVDRSEPGASPLLTVPLEPHGQTEALFDERHAVQYRQLADWILGLPAREHSDDAAESTVPETVSLHDNLPVQASQSLRRTPQQDLSSSYGFGLGPVHSASAGVSSNSGGPDPLAGMQTTPGADWTKWSSSVKRGRMPKRFVPVDPFDPEIFNRQFLRDAGPTGRPVAEGEQPRPDHSGK